MRKPLTGRDIDTLGELLGACDGAIKNDTRSVRCDGFVQVMDCGGGDATHHSATLTKLVKRGFAEVWMARINQPWRSKYSGGKLYRITDAGRELLEVRKRS